MVDKAKRLRRVLTWSIVTASVLVVVKFVTSIVTHSMAILASALDSLMDVAASAVNLFAVKEATQPPDEEHTYGHGKVESLAALLQCIFIGLSGFYIVFESVKRLFFGTTLHVIPLGIGIMVFSIVLTAVLVWRLSRLTKVYPSFILKSERLHYWTDILANIGVILALVLVRFTQGVYWDLLISIGITFYIFKATYEILRGSIDELLDRSLPPSSRSEIESLILEFHPSIIGVHSLRSRKAGEKCFLDFHIEIRGEDDFKKAHKMTETLIAKIQERYPGADVTVHFDPEGDG